VSGPARQRLAVAQPQWLGQRALRLVLLCVFIVAVGMVRVRLSREGAALVVSPPGDILAHSRGARSATMIEMLTGFALLATYLASFSEIVRRERSEPEAL
jgi:hypothetical protein